MCLHRNFFARKRHTISESNDRRNVHGNESHGAAENPLSAAAGRAQLCLRRWEKGARGAARRSVYGNGAGHNIRRKELGRKGSTLPAGGSGVWVPFSALFLKPIKMWVFFCFRGFFFPPPLSRRGDGPPPPPSFCFPGLNGAGNPSRPPPSLFFLFKNFFNTTGGFPPPPLRSFV